LQVFSACHSSHKYAMNGSELLPRHASITASHFQIPRTSWVGPGKLGNRRLNPLLTFPLDLRGGMVSSTHADFGHEADYLPIDAQDYVDYDYHRFGRGEKQLASYKKFPTHRQKRTWWWVSYFTAPFQRRSAGKI
jgi:hypothetical protein